MDALFAEGLLSIISLPILAWLFGAMLANSSCLDTFYSSATLEFGNLEDLGLLWGATVGYLPVVAVEVLIFISFFWPGRRRLSPGWSVGAAFWGMSIFGLSWFFWASE